MLQELCFYSWGLWSGHLYCEPLPCEEHWSPTLVETDMACGVGVPSVGVLGLLVTEPTLNRGTVILPAEVDAFCKT